jgi:MFS family permease
MGIAASESGDTTGSPGVGRLGLAVLLSSGALGGMAQMAIVPALPQLAAQYSGEGDGQFIAQSVMTVAGPAITIGAPLLGWLAGKIGNRAVLLMSALLYAAAGGAGAVAPDLWTLLLSRVLLGIATGGIGASATGILADNYAGPARDRLIGWNMALGGLGSLVSLLVAGPLVEHFGWRAPFWIYLVGLVMFVAALPSISNAKIAAPALRTEAGGAIGDASVPDSSVRGAWGYLALTVLLSMVINMIAVQGIFLLDLKGIKSPSDQSLIINMTTVGSMLGAFGFGWLRARVGYLIVLAAIWTVLGVGVLGFALVDTVLLFGLFALVSGLGSGLMAPLMQTAILGVVPPAANAKAAGLAVGAIFLGLVLNPFAMKGLRYQFDLQTSFELIGLAAFAGLALTLLLKLRAPRRPPLAVVAAEAPQG